jgi:hypothetical protein
VIEDYELCQLRLIAALVRPRKNTVIPKDPLAPIERTGNVLSIRNTTVYLDRERVDVAGAQGLSQIVIRNSSQITCSIWLRVVCHELGSHGADPIGTNHVEYSFTTDLLTGEPSVAIGSCRSWIIDWVRVSRKVSLLHSVCRNSRNGGTPRVEPEALVSKKEERFLHFFPTRNPERAPYSTAKLVHLCDRDSGRKKTASIQCFVSKVLEERAVIFASPGPHGVNFYSAR